MAIGKINYEVLKQLLPAITGRPAQIVAVGYPDMLITIDQVRTLFGKDVASAVRFRSDSDKIIAWHNLAEKLDGIIETEHFFSLIGMKMTVLDINEVRGGEIIQDLNMPLREELIGKFDIVYDGGTMEHCFNVGQAIQNFMTLAKVGGFIYHNNPFNVANHGFYNFNPTFYYDFYVDNGHQMAMDILAYYGGPLEHTLVKLPATGRFKAQKLPECWITAVARRMHDRPARWPLQTKYKLSPGLGS